LIIFAESNSVEIYNPASNSWKSGPSMNTARASFAAEVVKHQIIVLGETIYCVFFTARSEILYQSNQNERQALISSCASSSNFVSSNV